MKLLGGNKSVPKENEGSMGRQFSDVESHDLVPIPELNVGHPVRACVLLQRGLDENDVKFMIETFEEDFLCFGFVFALSATFISIIILFFLMQPCFVGRKVSLV